MATSVYFGVWNSLTPISDEEAARQYRLLRDAESKARRLDAEVYAFYSRLPRNDRTARDDAPAQVTTQSTASQPLPTKCRTLRRVCSRFSSDTSAMPSTKY